MKGTIKSKQRINELFEQGTRFARAAFLALYLPVESEAPTARLAYVAGKRLGDAPLRSRAKRRLREATRLAGGPWAGFDVVLVARERLANTDFSVLVSELECLGRRLSKHGSAPPSTKEQPRPLAQEQVWSNTQAQNQAQGSAQNVALVRNQAQKQDENKARKRSLLFTPPLSSCAEQSGVAGSTHSLPLEDSAMSATQAHRMTEGVNSNKRLRSSKILLIIGGIPRNIALSCIKLYRHAISPLFPPSCRYVPTCSEYALIAFERFGFWRGLRLSLKRIGRCHPLGSSGYDPVPETWEEKHCIVH